MEQKPIHYDDFILVFLFFRRRNAALLILQMHITQAGFLCFLYPQGILRRNELIGILIAGFGIMENMAFTKLLSIILGIIIL